MAEEWKPFFYAGEALHEAAKYAVKVYTLQLHNHSTSIYESGLHDKLAQAAKHLGFALVPLPAETPEQKDAA